MATAPATLEKKRKELGFNKVGMANGMPIYVCTESANASESVRRAVEAKLRLATHQLLLPGLSADGSPKDRFNDNGKSDMCFWIAGAGRDTNHLITETQEAEITDSQEAEVPRLAESGMKHTDIARKLGIPAAGVYYALKKRPERTKGSKSRRTSVLFTFDKEGNLVMGKGDSIEATVRVSKGSDYDPLLFFVLRDSYARVGGARFVLAACNGRQFGPDFVARVIVGVPQKPTLAKAKGVKAGQSF